MFFIVATLSYIFSNAPRKSERGGPDDTAAASRDTSAVIIHETIETWHLLFPPPESVLSYGPVRF